MPNLTITPASVVAAANAVVAPGIAGEAITAGQVVYKKSTDSKIYKALAAGTPEEASVVGIALNGASANQPIDYQSGGDLALGATTIKTTMYMLSAAAGGICPQADLVVTNRIVYLGYAKDLTGGFSLLRANTGLVV